MQRFHLAIISTGRPNNISFMEKVCQPFICNWFVNKGEADVYLKAGAKYVFEAGKNICEARNLAIELAFAARMPSIQVSDDLKSIKQISFDENGKRNLQFMSFEDASNLLLDSMVKNNSYYGGVAINNNPLNYTGVDVSLDKLIVNDLICMMPGKYRFDDDLALKEDYDMCVTQLLEGNNVVRLNNVLCDFPHRNNQGGANAYRNEVTEKIATDALMAKWPKYIIPHKTRAGQVSLNYKSIVRNNKGAEPTSLF